MPQTDSCVLNGTFHFDKFEGGGINYDNGFFKFQLEIPKWGIFGPKYEVSFALHKTFYLSKFSNILLKAGE